MVDDSTVGADLAGEFAAAGLEVIRAPAYSAIQACGPPQRRTVRSLEASPSPTQGNPVVGRARIECITSLQDLPPNTAMVIDAAVGTFDAKIATLRAIEDSIDSTAVIATAVTDHSVGEMATLLAHPGRLVGVRFFSPIASSSVVEVVGGPDTANSTVHAVEGYLRAIDKVGVVVKDMPGFITGRIGVALSLEAIRLLEDDVADAASIDRVMRDGFHYPFGPLTSTDLVGLDIRLAMADHLHSAYGERFRPPALLREKVARGELGRSTGQGFFTWDGDIAATPRSSSQPLSRAPMGVTRGA
ncbi:3-hydroxyacyl-CoA dehydrogenase family protein [Mycolicibacterium llatzerense]|uniref:3-hydroxyacyl-CoA dehydrogenase family protein n=1 Tax=Mycolicibacterium llatzerense TaxID=280871 RepID=UPI00178CC6C0|nr:3-hydroxyacyl-CoA dehydrogenase family protein [Mycolicibacterium llatzerense]